MSKRGRGRPPSSHPLTVMRNVVQVGNVVNAEPEEVSPDEAVRFFRRQRHSGTPTGWISEQHKDWHVHFCPKSCDGTRCVSSDGHHLREKSAQEVERVHEEELAKLFKGGPDMKPTARLLRQGQKGHEVYRVEVPKIGQREGKAWLPAYKAREQFFRYTKRAATADRRAESGV